MFTLYTAIGTLRFKKEQSESPVPVIINDHQEFGMSREELLLWSCLAFQILTIHELTQMYESRKPKDTPDTLTVSHYLNRLILRGLIVKGEGISGVDALYRLLGELYIVPIEERFPVRLFSCVHLFLEGKIKVSDWGKVLRKPKCPPIEKTILKLAQTVMLSTAELVTCIDQGKDIYTNQDVLEVLYSDSETTYKTLADDAQLNHTQYPVLQAIANLYLNKQISFQKF